MVGSKKQRIAGWIVCGLVSAFLLGGSAPGKFMDWEGKEEMFAKFGYSIGLMQKIGVVEVVLAVLLLIPRTSFIAAVLLTGYLGGAVATHVRISDPSFVMPLIVGVLVWVGVGLRTPGVFALAIGRWPSGACES